MHFFFAGANFSPYIPVFFSAAYTHSIADVKRSKSNDT